MIASEGLCCPYCGSELASSEHRVTCTSPSCAQSFPVIEGVPILIRRDRSIFRIEEIISNKVPFSSARRGMAKLLSRLVPSISKNICARQNFRRLAESLCEITEHPMVLVVGAGLEGEGIGELVADLRVKVVQADIRLESGINLICDAHDIPFCESTFDGVVLQAVLEHVLDPARCVEEVYRVLKTGGLVYAETPFMQQVHGGRHDFIRFTHLGHRWLFRRFAELRSGPVGGPGMALAWSYRYFLLSFVRSRWQRSAIMVLTGFTAFFLKYFDSHLATNPPSYDASSGFFFMGKKTGEEVTSADLLRGYVGS